VLWAKALIVGGLLLIGATFAVVEGDLRLPHSADSSPRTSVGHHTYECDSVIPAAWLVAGTASSTAPAPRTAVERRAAAQCATAVHRARVVMWGVMGLGALALLVGWTALRERELSPRRVPRVAAV
jgi:hypothetical protein